MRKIIALAMPLVFLSLITVQANAVITPVEVERVKDVCFIRVRGDHHTQSFVFHYVNLSPETQSFLWFGDLYDPDGNLVLWKGRGYTVPSGDSIDDTLPEGYGWILDFTIRGKKTGLLAEGLVVIPPPP